MFQGYETRPTEPSDAEALNALYRKVARIERSVAAWAWEWREGPFGAAPAWAIVESATGRIVGHHGVVPLPLFFGDRQIRAARTENSMVDPDHRRKFMYPAFEARILSELVQRFDLIFTTAGGGAQGAVRKRLGYIERGKWHTFSPGLSIGHMARRLPIAGPLIGQFADTVERRAPRGVVIEVTGDLGRVAQIWSCATRPLRLTPDRNKAFLEWRIGRHPNKRYIVGVVRRRGHDAGAVIWRQQRGQGGARIVTVTDLFMLEDNAEGIRDALVALGGYHRGKSARILVRTLDDDSPLAQTARSLTPTWALKGGHGSPIWVKSRHKELVEAPWTMTQLLAQES